ncbi:MAG TPA: glycerophosphodiester phosphodiesterase, partial [Acidimicrobiia bacterium]
MIALHPDGRPLILAHRGASAHAEGNTLAAFRLAVAHGADGVELDVRFTADDRVVVHHDPI